MRYLISHDFPLAVKQSALFHSAVFAYETISSSNLELQKTLSEICSNNLGEQISEQLNYDLRFAAFRNAWSIVEYLDQFRQVCAHETEFLKPNLQNSKLGEYFKIARKLRNHKIHFAQKTGQSSRAGDSIPQHGTLKWYYANLEMISKGSCHIFLAACEPSNTFNRKTDITFDLREDIPSKYKVATPCIRLLLGKETLELTETVDLMEQFSHELRSVFQNACSHIDHTKLAELEKKFPLYTPHFTRVTAYSNKDKD